MRQPGHGDRGGGGGRHELQVGEAERARHGPARDVDELHAAVGHGDLPLEHDAAAEQEVVRAQAVADRAHATRLERRSTRARSRRPPRRSTPQGRSNRGSRRAARPAMPAPMTEPTTSTTTYLGETPRHSSSGRRPRRWRSAPPRATVGRQARGGSDSAAPIGVDRGTCSGSGIRRLLLFVGVVGRERAEVLGHQAAGQQQRRADRRGDRHPDRRRGRHARCA